jgi:ubiquinone/menaquinone biosynthesis C-methylase UbiE
MDERTLKTKIWLDKRFKSCDEQGIYCAHQPIYGFRRGHCDGSLIDKYIPTYRIMKALSHLKFDSLLDVGAAEGYKAYIANKLFGVKVKCCDLSEEACKRAKGIFNIGSTSADIHELPFENNEFDVILCSETLEHVVDLHKSINELLRVARKAVIITVPHEPREIIVKNAKTEIPHAHIHSLDLESFNFLELDGHQVISEKMISPLLRFPTVLAEAIPREYHNKKKYPKILADIYNAGIPILNKIFGKKTAAFLIQMDDFVCKFTSSYTGILFIILKDRRCFTKEEISNISAYQIINFAVPYYYLEQLEK